MTTPLKSRHTACDGSTAPYRRGQRFRSRTQPTMTYIREGGIATDDKYARKRKQARANIALTCGLLAARTGFEPVISALRGRRPKPLDERAIICAIGWGGRSRTLTDGTRIRCPTIRRHPSIKCRMEPLCGARLHITESNTARQAKARIYLNKMNTQGIGFVAMRSESDPVSFRLSG